MSTPGSASVPTVIEPRHWWLPSFSQFIWLAFFLGLILTQWRLVLINADGDPCLHWRIGQWMIQHRAVIRVDAFSHTRDGAPLISKEWLAEVAFATLGDAFGWNGIVLLSAVLIATCLCVLHRQLLAEGNEPLLSTALILVAAWSCSVHWLARPHLFTHLFAVLFAWQLRWFNLGRLRAQTLFLSLVPLMILWVNLHGAFFTGLVVTGTFLVGDGVTVLVAEPTARFAARRRLVVLAALGLACMLATLLNPNGWKLPAHVLEFLRDPFVSRYANEFRSPNFHASGAHGFVAELTLVALTLLIMRPKLGVTDMAIVATWGLLALLAARNVPIFALMVTPILAAHWQTALRSRNPSPALDRYCRLSANLTQINRTADGRVITAVVLVALLAVMAKPRLVGGDPLIATNILSNRFPVAATGFIAAHPRAVNGEMFNDYGWGGYFILAMPEHKVFVDGRNDFYGADLIREFDAVNQVHRDWETVLEKYRVGWTILPRGHALNNLLALRDDWHRVYADKVAIVYARDLRKP
ncbi:MAG TPA: hypothetical protein VL486_01345 [Verrucomicrobiae bacterium]|nr:hypothetical protein [Verrucomicrobiae bacterium]